MQENYGIVITIAFGLLILYLLIRHIATGIKSVKAQGVVLLMMLNNVRTAKGIGNVRYVITTAFQSSFVYPGGPVDLKIPKNWSLPIHTAHGLLDITFRGIFANARIFDAEKAFFNSPSRRPLISARFLLMAQLTEILSDPEFGEDLLTNGTGAIQDALIHAVNEIAEQWGVRIKTLLLGDFDTPPAILDATDFLIQSDAEVKAYQAEKTAQGPDYLVKQFLDILPKTRISVLGGSDGIIKEVMAAIVASKDTQEVQ